MLYPSPPLPSGHADFGRGGKKVLPPLLSLLWRELAASGRQRALYQYKYFVSLGRESFFSDPPDRKDLATRHPPLPPDYGAAWGRGAAMFRANCGLYLIINICSVYRSSLLSRPSTRLDLCYY